MPRFDCTERCQAPDSFASGVPFLAIPANRNLTLDIESSQSTDHTMQWQFIRFPSETIGFGDLNIVMNGQLIVQQMSTFKGMKYSFEFGSIGMKVSTVTLVVEQTGAMTDNIFKVELAIRNKGKAENGYVIWTKPAKLTKWTDWSSCSVSCQVEGAANGYQVRTRKCLEGFNTDQNCELICPSCDPGNLTEKDQKICPVHAGVIQYCPIQSSWAEWVPWGYCSADCGPSFRRRHRACVDGKYGGSACSNRFDNQEEKCDKKVRLGSLLYQMKWRRTKKYL